MNQRTHAWLAMRAIALFEDLKEVPRLLKILKPHTKSAAIGAWIPDLRDSKVGSGRIDNHILKMKPYTGSQKGRFIVPKDKLLDYLGPGRAMTTYLAADTTLSPTWWGRPYRADPRPGQHLANRAQALTTTLVDLLIFGDPAVAKLVPGTVKFAAKLAPNARSRAEQVATYCFMLSHFVADSCMPCHSDARYLAGYSRGLHKELEQHWAKGVGTYFEKKKLFASRAGATTILNEARAIDAEFGLKFPARIPRLRMDDVWKEMVMVCRGSFALANIIARPSKYPYKKKGKISRNTVSYKKIFSDAKGTKLLADLDRVILQDAVFNIAVVWKHIWETF